MSTMKKPPAGKKRAQTRRHNDEAEAALTEAVIDLYRFNEARSGIPGTARTHKAVRQAMGMTQNRKEARLIRAAERVLRRETPPETNGEADGA